MVAWRNEVSIRRIIWRCLVYCTWFALLAPMIALLLAGDSASDRENERLLYRSFFVGLATIAYFVALVIAVYSIKATHRRTCDRFRSDLARYSSSGWNSIEHRDRHASRDGYSYGADSVCGCLGKWFALAVCNEGAPSGYFICPEKPLS